MKPNQIQPGKSYEIKLGKNTSKVKVASFDESHGTWLCETASGKTLRIKESVRFLKEVGQRADAASWIVTPHR